MRTFFGDVKMEKARQKTTAVDSQVKVSLPKTKTAVIERKMTSKGIAEDMVSRITAKLIGFGDLYDPKTNRFLSEAEMVAKGAVFLTIAYKKALVIGKDTVKKSRSTKEPIPYISVVKTSKYQVIANINWESYINKRGDGNFVSAETRANGVENYEACKGIGVKGDNYYVNGVAFKSLESAKYFADGNEVDKDTFERDFGKVASKASKQKEADKHGIDIRFDPKYRTTRIDSCEYIRAFGFRYIPTDNILNP